MLRLTPKSTTSARPGRPARRHPRGLHPQRLPRGRREARRHARAHGRQPDDVRRLRPRLRRRSGTRSTPNKVLSDAGPSSAVSLHASGRATARMRRHHERPRKGVLGRRHAQIYVNPTLPAGATYAAGAHAPVRTAFQNLTDPANPGTAGRAEDHEQGGAAQRRRHRLAAPEPQRRRRRRAARRPTSSTRRRPARRSRSRSSSGSTATCRTWSTSPHNINMHATFVAAGPGIRSQPDEQVAGRAGDRPRADARVPAEHPRPAERARPDPATT